MSTHKPIKLAMIGAGIFAHDAHLQSLANLGNQFEVVAVYSRTESSAQKLIDAISPTLRQAPIRIYTDIDILLANDDIEAVNIVLPIPIIAQFIEKSLLAGKHVISEKPIAANSEEAQHLIDLHQGQNTVWMVGENWRYESAFVKAAEIIQRGDIGRPITCHWSVHIPMIPSNKYYSRTWRRSGEFQGGLVLDSAVHQVAALRMMIGEITAISAMTAQVSPDNHPVDQLSAILQFENGALGTFQANHAKPVPATPHWSKHCFIVGESGTMRVERGDVYVWRESSKNGPEKVECPKYDGVENELAAFGQSIRAGEGHRNTPYEGLRDLQIIEAMLESGEDED
ncbi:MAG: Gfo/Idh/MocA family oxidoreductase [Chloroflexota bacterium]